MIRSSRPSPPGSSASSSSSPSSLGSADSSSVTRPDGPEPSSRKTGRARRPPVGPGQGRRILNLDRYVPRASPIHRADARGKVLLALAFILVVSLLPAGAFVAIGLAWGAILVGSLVARLPLSATSRSAFLAAPFLLAALPLVVTRSGEPLGTVVVGPLSVTISGEGLRLFATIAAKSWVSVQAALLLAFTTPIPELIEALRRLRLPGLLVATIGFMVRYLTVLGDEAGRMGRAREARSADPTGRGGGSLRWRATVTGHMVGTLFLRSYERSERIYAAMLARGFEGTLLRLPGRPIEPVELAGFALAGLVVALVGLAGWLWLPTL